MHIQNAFLVLKKNLATEGKVDVVEDDIGNKNLCDDEVLSDNHIDAHAVGTIRLDSPGNLSNKTTDLVPKLVFGKKDGDNNNVNVVSDPISKRERSFPILNVSNDSSTTGATFRRARSLTSVLPPRVAQ
ncbi:LOW QUALITY PROTEIN: hypothetical protein PanWU01x14_186540 [Parasponia andersonii]|uniref:Uncharacterized protein n=1 Tax=Parasponia andersonii TaxID=3476 RepID=A0A2P5C3R8_PARAD|nr:LOW QUALITY PROTEIN: hypothetical protein PanWU01x14_186540 [Parasponia andersonii]